VGGVSWRDQRPGGKWKGQVRREGCALSKTFVMKADADAWVRETEGRIDRGEDRVRRKAATQSTFGDFSDQHSETLATYDSRTSKDA